jgi:hypothetical protein
MRRIYAIPPLKTTPVDGLGPITGVVTFWKRDPQREPRSKYQDQRRAFFFDERSDKPSL